MEMFKAPDPHSMQLHPVLNVCAGRRLGVQYMTKALHFALITLRRTAVLRVSESGAQLPHSKKGTDSNPLSGSQCMEFSLLSMLTWVCSGLTSVYAHRTKTYISSWNWP